MAGEFGRSIGIRDTTPKSLQLYLRPMVWVWVKIKAPGIGPQVLVHVSIYQSSILGTYF